MPAGDVEAFKGFPSSGLATPVPNLFFSRLLPELESVEELIVTLYFFFAQTLKPRRPRYLSLPELRADATLVRALSRHCGEGGALERGLALAVRRGTLLGATAGPPEAGEPVFLLNTPANVRALAGLSGEAMRLEEPLPPAEPVATTSVFALFEENIGTITPLIAQELQEAEERYPARWLREAIREAAALNKRSWRYVERILRRWEAEGPDYEEPGRDPEAQWLEQRYREGRNVRRRAGA